MILLGLTGPIGHGKTTFANALAKLEPSLVHLESSMVVSDVANAMQAAVTTTPDPYSVDSLNEWLKSLPQVVTDITHVKCTYDDIKLHQSEIERHPIEYQKLIMHVENMARNPMVARTIINRDNKETYRPFLQWLGGYLVEKTEGGIWYNEIVRRVKDVEDASCKLCIVGGLRYPLDATILRKAGGIIVKVYRPGHLQNDMLDPTERERENIKVDCTIISSGSIEDLADCAKLFLDDVKKNELQTSYQSKHH